MRMHDHLARLVRAAVWLRAYRYIGIDMKKLGVITSSGDWRGSSAVVCTARAPFSTELDG